MSDEKKPYEKIGSEYVFALKDEVTGATFTAKVGVTAGAAGDTMIGADTLALFPDRSSNHRRIKALLDAEKAKKAK